MICLNHTLSVWLGTQITQHYIHVADRKYILLLLIIFHLVVSSYLGLSGKYLKSIQNQLLIDLSMEDCQILMIYYTSHENA